MMHIYWHAGDGTVKGGREEGEQMALFGKSVSPDSVIDANGPKPTSSA
jgi:hypothetical protein